ncbi:hypothetical protein F7725_010656 [Dissostichus mawsoni]|uniref:Uncharacterized protein n=1 Tax=Dissostichus mawsoni TaxID=36200 RepID=A0A7J5XS21_DISMA|nr:hypothetical protein F7725_010656 [Dissostichus mawsoni]
MQPNDTHSQCNTYCLHLDCSKQDNNGEMKMVAIEYFISYFVMNPSQLHFVQILPVQSPLQGSRPLCSPPIIHIIITRSRRICWNVFKNLNVIIEFSPFLLAQRFKLSGLQEVTNRFPDAASSNEKGESLHTYSANMVAPKGERGTGLKVKNKKTSGRKSGFSSGRYQLISTSHPSVPFSIFWRLSTTFFYEFILSEMFFCLSLTYGSVRRGRTLALGFVRSSIEGGKVSWDTFLLSSPKNFNKSQPDSLNYRFPSRGF